MWLIVQITAFLLFDHFDWRAQIYLVDSLNFIGWRVLFYRGLIRVNAGARALIKNIFVSHWASKNAQGSSSSNTKETDLPPFNEWLLEVYC